jgi:hypothetical protein
LEPEVRYIRAKEAFMEGLEIAGYIVAALLLAGILLNWRDIRRYIHISRI